MFHKIQYDQGIEEFKGFLDFLVYNFNSRSSAVKTAIKRDNYKIRWV